MNVLEVNFEKKLKNFPLHIQFQAEGGCIGILGASGCGKKYDIQKRLPESRHPIREKSAWENGNCFTEVIK